MRERKFSPQQVSLARHLARGDYDYMAALLQARRDNGLTQEDVASRLGVSVAAIKAIEAQDANPTLNTLRQYALAIGAEVTHVVRNHRASGGET